MLPGYNHRSRLLFDGSLHLMLFLGSYRAQLSFVFGQRVQTFPFGVNNWSPNLRRKIIGDNIIYRDVFSGE